MLRSAIALQQLQLQSCTQQVCLTGSSSVWANVSNGVPQGCVLGPLLFLIYINDIDNGIASNILKFADDMKLYRHVETAEDIANLRNDWRKLVGWSK
jgi:ribonuclease P/MRP protein subunit RPP40